MEEAKQELASTSVVADATTRLEPKLYVDSRQESQPAPLIYKPDGSFTSLVQQNKLAATDPATLSATQARKDRENRKHKIPGCTMYTRGSQHVAGRTYGNATETCFEADYRDLAQASVIPDNPTENREIEHKLPDGSFVTHHFGDKPYHLPGYTGHVRGIKDEFGITYGNVTHNQMSKLQKEYPERTGNQKGGMAKTVKPPHKYVLNSNPLPGGVPRADPPRKLVPGHLDRLSYY